MYSFKCVKLIIYLSYMAFIPGGLLSMAFWHSLLVTVSSSLAELKKETGLSTKPSV